MIHSPEELKAFTRTTHMLVDVRSTIYFTPELDIFLSEEQGRLMEELNKYAYLANLSGVRQSDIYCDHPRQGIISMPTHFAANDIMVHFEYDSGGFDTVQLSKIDLETLY